MHTKTFSPLQVPQFRRWLRLEVAEACTYFSYTIFFLDAFLSAHRRLLSEQSSYFVQYPPYGKILIYNKLPYDFRRYTSYVSSLQNVTAMNNGSRMKSWLRTPRMQHQLEQINTPSSLEAQYKCSSLPRTLPVHSVHIQWNHNLKVPSRKIKTESERNKYKMTKHDIGNDNNFPFKFRRTLC